MVGDALLELAAAVVRFGRSEIVSLLLRVDGRDVRARLLLNAVSSPMVVDALDDRPIAAAEARPHLQR